RSLPPFSPSLSLVLSLRSLPPFSLSVLSLVLSLCSLPHSLPRSFFLPKCWLSSECQCLSSGTQELHLTFTMCVCVCVCVFHNTLAQAVSVCVSLVLVKCRHVISLS